MTVDTSKDLPASIHSLLSSSPPFVTKDSLGLLSRILDPVSSGTKSGGANQDIWRSLNNFVPPISALNSTSSFDFLKLLEKDKRSKDIHSLTTSLKVAFSTFSNELNLQQLATTANKDLTVQDLEIVDDDSICLSVPLNPTSVDQVTLTPHRIELVVPNSSSTSNQISSSTPTKWWGFGRKERVSVQENVQVSAAQTTSGKTKVVARKVFYPPIDKLSIKCCWWGYEIFLPHVLMISVGQNVEKGLSTLSTAISFLLNHIPTSLLTLPAIPFILSMLPILSTIDGFLSFYWKEIVADDLGSGTILSACWLLPVALIPRTLDLKEWGEGADEKPLPVDVSTPTPTSTIPAVVPTSPSVATVGLPSTTSAAIVDTKVQEARTKYKRIRRKVFRE